MNRLGYYRNLAILCLLAMEAGHRSPRAGLDWCIAQGYLRPEGDKHAITPAGEEAAHAYIHKGFK